MDETTKKIADFYGHFNFPSKNKISDFDVFFALLGQDNTKFLKNKKILDAGCGTGERSSYLAYCGAEVIGIDLSLSSLKKATSLAKKNKINNAHFVKMDLMEPKLKKKQFDYIVCDGVLHHLSDPFMGLKNMSNLLKKRGYIIFGLYNHYSSLMIRIKRKIISTLNVKRERKIKIANFLFNKNKKLSKQNKIWIADQFLNPNEAYFSVSSILTWFKLNNLNYVSSFPPIEIGKYADMIFNKDFRLVNIRQTAIKNLIKKENKKLKGLNNNKLLHILIQLFWNLPGGKDYFYMCGQKK
ncbi:MAG: class I SAM-dependent methyltransferase [Nanoarchaeota archaeon]